MGKQKQTDPVIPMIRVSAELKSEISALAEKAEISESRLVREILEAVVLQKLLKLEFQSPIRLSSCEDTTLERKTFK